ncbi:hypothetical protein C8R44DRAFT_889381 [Mycena epipterygia]|nr:hypothetical protein C8R44DRAFT_889381 [Mycena epipterygia]
MFMGGCEEAKEKRKRREEDLEMDEKREGMQDLHEVTTIDQGLTTEKAAIFHLVHCWYQEGTTDNVPHMTWHWADSMEAVSHKFFSFTEEVAVIIGA